MKHMEFWVRFWLFVSLLLFPSGVFASDADGDALWVDEVEFVSTNATLVPVMQLAVTESIPPFLLTQDLAYRDAERIVNTGYFSDVVAHLEHRDGMKVLVYSSTAFPVVSSITIEGVPEADLSSFISIIPMKIGDPFNEIELEKSSFKAREWFVENGYPLGRLMWFYIDEQGDLYLTADPGIVGFIEFDGVSEDRIRQLKGKVTFRVGEALRENDLLESLKNIARVPFVDSVSPSWMENDEGHVGIIFNITTKPTGQYSVGVGYNTEDGFLALGSISDADFLKSGRTLGADVRISQRRNALQVKYIDPTLCTCWDDLQLRLHFEQEKDSIEGNEIHSDVGLSVGIRKDLTPTLELLSGFSYRWLGDTNQTRRLFALDNSLHYHALDKSLGVSVFTRWATPILQSDYSFLKVRPEAHFQLLSGDRSALTVRGGLGYIRGESIPQHEYFRVGGLGTLRGYSYASLVGNKMYNATIEYAYGFFDNQVKAFVFLDAADAWSKSPALKLNTSIGVGARVHTPIGNIELSLATDEFSKPRLVFGAGTDW